jgi:hypothetical protein
LNPIALAASAQSAFSRNRLDAVPEETTMPDSGDCKIKSTPFSTCPFTATPGAVALHVVNIVGTVTFVQATYSGGPVAVTPNSISFTIVAGRTTLDVLYFFSDTVAGQGALH